MFISKDFSEFILSLESLHLAVACIIFFKKSALSILLGVLCLKMVDNSCTTSGKRYIVFRGKRRETKIKNWKGPVDC